MQQTLRSFVSLFPPPSFDSYAPSVFFFFLLSRLESPTVIFSHHLASSRRVRRHADLSFLCLPLVSLLIRLMILRQTGKPFFGVSGKRVDLESELLRRRKRF